jgi:hypothetical protein
MCRPVTQLRLERRHFLLVGQPRSDLLDRGVNLGRPTDAKITMRLFRTCQNCISDNLRLVDRRLVLGIGWQIIPRVLRIRCVDRGRLNQGDDDGKIVLLELDSE